MDSKDLEDHLIANFLNKSLTDSELLTFKKKFQNEPEFVEKVRNEANLKITLGVIYNENEEKISFNDKSHRSNS